MNRRASAEKIAFKYLWAKNKFERTTKKIKDLEINEYTAPQKGGRYRRTSIGRDKEGYFVMTHRARSKSYETPEKIPDSQIKFIESTG